jgi:hypothetical protein
LFLAISTRGASKFGHMSEGKSKKNLRILLYLVNPLETILDTAISEIFPSKFGNFGRFYSQKSFV